jgi:hypothetical protein
MGSAADERQPADEMRSGELTSLLGFVVIIAVSGRRMYYGQITDFAPCSLIDFEPLDGDVTCGLHTMNYLLHRSGPKTFR